MEKKLGGRVWKKPEGRVWTQDEIGSGAATPTILEYEANMGIFRDRGPNGMWYIHPISWTESNRRLDLQAAKAAARRNERERVESL